MARRKPSRWASQAAQEAIVRFGPEESGLRELQNTIQQTLASDISAAHGAGTNIVNSIDQAAPAIRQIYDQAGLDQAGIASGLRADTAGLGDVARTVKGAIAVEGARAATNIVGQRTAALTDLSQRRVAARAGENWQVQKARSTFATDLAKVLQRKIDLAREKGAFTAQTEGELTQAQRDRQLKVRLENAGNQQSERNSLRSAGIDPNTGKPIKNGPLDPNAPSKKPKPGTTTASGGTALSKDKHFEVAQSIKKIASYAHRYATENPGWGRDQVRGKLVKGRPQASVQVDDKGKIVTKKAPGQVTRTVPIPALPSFDPNLEMSAALDVAIDGHLSRETTRQLQTAGFRVQDLGLPTYTEWKRKRPPAAGRSQVTQVARALAGASALKRGR